jgi:hypothetical protein
VITTSLGSWNVTSQTSGEVIPGQSPDVVTGNDTELLNVKRWVELLHVLPGMRTGLGTRTVQIPPPRTMSATNPELLTAATSTDVALAAVKVHMPVIVIEPVSTQLEQG